MEITVDSFSLPNVDFVDAESHWDRFAMDYVADAHAFYLRDHAEVMLTLKDVTVFAKKRLLREPNWWIVRDQDGNELGRFRTSKGCACTPPATYPVE